LSPHSAGESPVKWNFTLCGWACSQNELESTIVFLLLFYIVTADSRPCVILFFDLPFLAAMVTKSFVYLGWSRSIPPLKRTALAMRGLHSLVCGNLL
jgi:hypothetical protein